MNREPKKTVSVRLSEKQYEQLRVLSRESNRTAAGFLRHLLVERIWTQNRNRPGEGTWPYGNTVQKIDT